MRGREWSLTLFNDHFSLNRSQGDLKLVFGYCLSSVLLGDVRLHSLGVVEPIHEGLQTHCPDVILAFVFADNVQ